MATHITIGDISPRIQYTGDGATLAFTYPFPIFADADMEVFEDAAIKTLSTDYTVSGAGNSSGGTVTFAAAPANGTVVTLRRNVTIERTSDFQESGEFRAKVINDELDAITAVQQQLADGIGRSIRLPDTDPAATLTLPDKATRADNFINFDPQGNVTVSSTVALPSSLTGNALKYLRANSGETTYEFRTAAEVFTSLLATEGTGFIAHVGSGVAEPRTLTGTASEIDVSNGDGVGGNPTFALPGTIALAGKTVTADAPTTGSEVATKNYVDAAIAGISTRWTVRAASTANVAIATGLENGDIVDGVTLAAGDEVLLKNQTAPAENGIYTVVAAGAASRSIDYDTWAELIGMLIAAQEGTANADKLFLCTANTGGTLGTTAVTYSTVTPGTGGTVTSITAGTGLSGGTITTAGTLALDINGLTSVAAIDPAADVLSVYDASAAAPYKVTPTYLLANSINGLVADATPDGAADYVVTYDASALTAKKVLVSNVGSLGLIQTVGSQDGAAATGTTLIPWDDTIPQNTEGDQYMSVTITPTSATNKLIITHVGQYTYNAAGVRNLIAALFQDTTVAALAAISVFEATSDNAVTISLTHTMVSGTTAPTTFKIRVGVDVVAGTITFNGLGGLRKLGGVSASTLIVQEVAA